jgi:IS1 family transposase/transposase-like protein
MATIEVEVTCPNCNSKEVVKNGKDKNNKQRFLCRNEECNQQTFLMNYSRIGGQPHIKKLILKMAVNASGIRDTARVLEISPTTVIETLKKADKLTDNINPKLLEKNGKEGIEIDIVPINAIDVELDEMWSFVEKKSNQRWLWLAIDHNTGETIAFVFGRRKDEVFLKLKKLLEPFHISKYYTDNWGSYSKNLDEDKHEIGKRNTQTIERKNLTLRTRVKRLTRRTICFSKMVKMHDIVIALLINVLDFGLLL